MYRTDDGKTRVEVRLYEETVWMTQADIAELYQTTPQNITLHLKAIYEEGELNEEATCKKYLQVQNEGSRKVSRKRKFYNLSAIIAVGYRVRSNRGTQFRRWAKERLDEFYILTKEKCFMAPVRSVKKRQMRLLQRNIRNMFGMFNIEYMA